MAKVSRTTAASRIAFGTTLVFAAGTALVFFVLYLIVARAVRDRSDAWLRGEAETLAQVSADTPNDHLYKRIMEEVAELATREVPHETNEQGSELNSVFFLQEDPSNDELPLWVGPSSDNTAFLKAIHRTGLTPDVPQSLDVDGWPMPFRVVAQQVKGRRTYLGLSSRVDMQLLNTLTRRFLLLWGGTVLMGFLISYAAARRTLLRVERITETAERIGSKELGERLPEPIGSDEISRLAKTFNRMLDRIQSSVAELRSVTDGVAHDMRSPITSIRGTLESALSSHPNESWRDSIAEAIESLDRLLNLLNTTLDVAEGQAGALRLDRSPVDLSAVVQQFVDLYQPAMAERGHELAVAVEGGVLVDADMTLLHRVVSNLLENELIHIPAGCKIEVRLRSHEGFAKLVIEDNGPGFPPEIIRRAFERFVKGKQSPGHGLGLAFVHAVIQAHGGVVKISDRPTGGAVVALSLPALRLTSISAASGTSHWRPESFS
jgi:signal transduction histidine kinase